MKFCSHCANPLTVRIPPGDNLPRHVCPRCGVVHYQNPKIVTGCIAEWDDRILLCRRAIEPRYGKWTLPAGFMENNETVAEGAAREAFEEARAEVIDLELYGVFNIPHISQVYIMFRGRLARPQVAAGAESLDVRLVGVDDIPWPDLAFQVVHRTLRLYVADRAANRFGTHVGDILPPDRDGRRTPGSA